MEIDNLKLKREVYKPAEDSTLLAENLLVEKGDAVLDVGTGTGILALTAAEKAERVVGTDINPIAVELARENARVNGIGNVEFVCCDLFPPGNERFDLIVFNPPYLPVNEPGLLEKAWSGGRGGIEIIERFLDSVSNHLKDGGVFELLVSSLGDMERIDEVMKKNQIEYDIIVKRKLFFEELSVIKGKIFNH